MIYIEFVLRISLSLALGFLIGLERQLTGHPAGIRINVLICMGTSFFSTTRASVCWRLRRKAIRPRWALSA